MAAKAKRAVIKVLVVLAVAVTSVLLVRAVFNYTTGRALERYLTKAKAEGVPLRMEDIAPRCSDADNGALLWKAAEALFVLPEAKEGKLAADSINGFYNGRSLDGDARKVLGLVCDKNRRIFELIVEAAAKPCFKYGDWTKGPWSVEMIKAVKTIQATRLLGIDAVLQADAGQVALGLEECRNGMHFVQKLTNEPLLLNNLVALAEMKILLECFDQIASGREMDQATLSAWMKELDAVSWRQRFVRWIPTERAVGLDWALRAVSGRPGDLSSALAVLGNERGIDRFFYWLIRPILRSQLIWVHRRYGELERRVDEPYYEQVEFLEKERQVPWYYKATDVLLPDFRSAFLKEASLEAMMLATRAGLACKIYKSKTGNYPTNLEVLVPDILPEVPIDPFTGKPFVFRIKDGELLIYSLGSNQKDDGGRMSTMTQLVMDKDDDWTWREKVR
ncbi:MAG TPA: hypothetical protein VMS77_05375 [Conexivisphaerales archaeon]|nr:hypothetical protein [Conexivisphaerales archaeon]